MSHFDEVGNAERSVLDATCENYLDNDTSDAF